MSNKLTLCLFFLLSVPSVGGAYETDQFNNRQQLIEDSTAVMNKQVTLAIASTIAGLYGDRDQMKVVDNLLQELDLGQIPCLVLFNKADKVKDDTMLLKSVSREGIVVSALGSGTLKPFLTEAQKVMGKILSQ